jgi:ABC-type glycerol-3-phosphate transport system substrate-binding protein
MHRIRTSMDTGVRLLLLFILLTSPVACNGKKQPAKNATATSLPTQGSSPDVETSGPVVITFAGLEYQRQLYEPLMAEFHQQNPEITVQFVNIPEVTSITQEVIAGYPRLLASSADTTAASGFTSGASAFFRDLTPLMETDTGFNAADFWPAASQACQDADGHVLGIPASILLRGVYYDAQAFDQAGLPHPASGWTWDDFRKDVTALAKKQGETIRYGYAERFGTILSPLIEATLADYNGEILPAALQPVVQWYLDQVNLKAIRPTPDYEHLQGTDDWDALFKSENRPAMWAGNLGDPMPGRISTDLAIQEYGFAPYPASAGSPTGNHTPVWVQCLAISSGSPNPRAAWLWLEFLSQHWLTLDKTASQAILDIPGRSSVAEAQGFWKLLPDDIQTTVRYILEQDGYVLTQYTEAAGAVSKALARAATGTVDFATALDEAKTQLSAAPSAPGEPVVVATPMPTQNSASNASVVRFYPNTRNRQELDALTKLVDQFNQAHPDIVVKMQEEFSPSQGKDYYASFANHFDCFMAQVDPMGAAKSGVFLSLNTLLDAEEPAFRNDFDPALLNASRYGEELYDLPIVSQPPVISYNADLLAKRGLQPPDNNWTFSDFSQQIEAVASTSKDDLSYGFMLDSQTVNTHGMFLSGRGVQWLDRSGDLPVAKLATPEMANALAWLAGLAKSGALFIPSSGDEWWSSISYALESGQIAFWTSLAGESDLGAFSSNETPSYKIGVAPLPVIPEIGDAFDARNYERGIYISSQAQNPQACWTWIKFLSEQPTTFNGVPARKSVADSAAWEASVGADKATVYRLALARIQSNESTYTSAWMEMPLDTWNGQAFNAALKGEDYQALLPALQTKADAYLACISKVDQAKLTDDTVKTEVNNCARQADPQGDWGPSEDILLLLRIGKARAPGLQSRD